MSDIGPVIGFTDSETGEFFLAEKLLSDAERWQYVKEKMAVGHGHPGNRHFYLYGDDDQQLYVGKGDTIDEVIDKLRNA